MSKEKIPKHHKKLIDLTLIDAEDDKKHLEELEAVISELKNRVETKEFQNDQLIKELEQIISLINKTRVNYSNLHQSLIQLLNL